MNSIQKANRQALVNYFIQGAKTHAHDAEQKLVGIELEHIVVDEKMMAIPYESDTYSVKDLLEDLAEYYPEPIMVDGHLLGRQAGKSTITIEPCAQLELSAGPFNNLKDAEETFTDFEQKLASILEPHHAQALTIGYDPHYCAMDKPLIPKDRYKYMHKYLSAISMYGPAMMRCSASAQISIDYTDEADAMRKLRLSSIAAPLFALMTDNAPVFEGHVRTEHMVRTRIWKEIDVVRASTIPGVTRRDYSFEDYADYVLGVPAIVALDAQGNASYSKKSFHKLFKHTEMTKADIEHALSMVFPDVRLKQFIEIRPADSMPIPYVIAYAALIKGLFYSEDSLQKMDDLFGDVRRNDIDAAKEELMAYGYRAIVYERDAAALCDKLITYAREGLSEDERSYLEPLAEMVEAKSTFADLGGTIYPLERLKNRRDFV